MGGAPIRFRGSWWSRVSDSPCQAGLIGSSGSAVRRDYRSLPVRVPGSNAEGAVPKPMVREMSQSWWTRHRIRSGWTRVGRDRDHGSSSSCARLLAFNIVGLASPRSGAANPDGTGLYDVRLRHVAVLNRDPPDFRATDRQPTLNAIRSFSGLDHRRYRGPGYRPRMRCEGDPASLPALAVGYAAKGADLCGSSAPGVSSWDWQGKRIHEGQAGRK